VRLDKLLDLAVLEYALACEAEPERELAKKALVGL
jgi:hypothetical protein